MSATGEIQTHRLPSGKTLELVSATPEDAARILAHLKSAGGETPFLSFGAEGLPMTEAAESEFIRNSQKDRTAFFLIGQIEGEIAGLLTLVKLSRARLCHAADFGISVRKKYWRQGVGRLLMDQMVSWARANDVRKIDLRVHEDNTRATEMYLKFGFEMEGTRKRAVRDGAGFKSEHIMGMAID